MYCKPPKPTIYIPVHGTWAIDEGELAWWKAKSEFSQYARRFNMFQFASATGHPFYWTSDLNGVSYNFLSKNQKKTDWLSGGYALIYYLQNTLPHERNIIAHSHGLQVVLFACAHGLKINNLISVCSPIRDDMNLISTIARPNIKNWLHIYDSSDRIQFLGQFGDGRLFGSRTSKFADENQRLAGINHSDVLKVGAQMDLWSKYGWFDFLRK